MDDILCNLVKCTFRRVLAIILKNIQPPSGILFIAAVANCSFAHKMKGLFGFAFLLFISVGKLSVLYWDNIEGGLLCWLPWSSFSDKRSEVLFFVFIFFLHASGKSCLGYLSKKSCL